MKHTNTIIAGALIAGATILIGCSVEASVQTAGVQAIDKEHKVKPVVVTSTLIGPDVTIVERCIDGTVYLMTEQGGIAPKMSNAGLQVAKAAVVESCKE